MLDLTRLQELCEEIGRDDVGLIIDVYLEEAEGVLDAIQPDTDPGERSRSLHFLRSGALNLGLVEFAGVATEANRKEVIQDVFRRTQEAVSALWAFDRLSHPAEATP
jgi:hypothetical protein